MAASDQGGGEMDVLAGYIAPPIDENGGVRFTVIDGVRVTTSLEGRDEVQQGTDSMAVLDDRTMDRIVLDRGVRFTGKPGETVTILLEQIPRAQQPGFRESGDDGVELKVSIPVEGSSSKTDEPSDSEARSRKEGPVVPFEEKKEPVEEELRKEFEQKLELSPRGEKEEELSVDPQSDANALRQAVEKFEAMNELLKLYMENLEDKESNFIKGNLADKKLKEIPGIDVAATKRLNELGISTAQDLYDKYKEGTVQKFKDWAPKDKAAGGVEMQMKYCKAVIRGYTLREMYPDQ